jgi:DNA-binding IclR family transcriptional regulator
VARRVAASVELRRLIDEVRRTFIAVNSPEDHGVRVLAAPVFERNQIVAAIAVVGTAVALSGDAESASASVLRRVAGDLSKKLAAD